MKLASNRWFLVFRPLPLNNFCLITPFTDLTNLPRTECLSAKMQDFCPMFRLGELVWHFSVSCVSDIFCENIQEAFPPCCPPCPSSEVGQLNWICHKTSEDLFPRIQSDLPKELRGSISLGGTNKQGWWLPRGQTLKWHGELLLNPNTNLNKISKHTQPNNRPDAAGRKPGNWNGNSFCDEKGWLSKLLRALIGSDF